MFHSRSLNNRINKIDERALRIVLKDTNSTFNELLKGWLSNYTGTKQPALATEMFKVFNGISPRIVTDVFPLKESNIYCIKFTFKTRNGTEKTRLFVSKNMVAGAGRD